MLLKHIINSASRDYFIERVNGPLVKAIVLLAGRYPEPTHENVVHPNTHILLDIRDKFFASWHTRPRTALYEALWRMLIVKYEHSPTYRYMLEWLVRAINQSAWKPWNTSRQINAFKGE